MARARALAMSAPWTVQPQHGSGSSMTSSLAISRRRQSAALKCTTSRWRLRRGAFCPARRTRAALCLCLCLDLCVPVPGPSATFGLGAGATLPTSLSRPSRALSRAEGSAAKRRVRLGTEQRRIAPATVPCLRSRRPYHALPNPLCYDRRRLTTPRSSPW